jgi:hypothetical protein
MDSTRVFQIPASDETDQSPLFGTERESDGLDARFLLRVDAVTGVTR